MTYDVGEQVDDFETLDAAGQRVPVSALVDERLVLVFYRGYW